MKCPNCGNIIEDNSLFCTNCGGRLDNIDKELLNESDSQQTGEMSESVSAENEKPVQSIYVNTAAAVKKPSKTELSTQSHATKKKRVLAPCRPISTWGFVWRSLIFCIPVLNIIFLFLFAFADGVNENSRSYARSVLILMLVSLILVIISAILCYIFRSSITDWFVHFSENLKTLAN